MRLLFSSTLTRLPQASMQNLRDRDAAARAAPDSWSALMEAAQNGHGGAYRRLLNEMTNCKK